MSCQFVILSLCTLQEHFTPATFFVKKLMWYSFNSTYNFAELKFKLAARRNLYSVLGACFMYVNHNCTTTVWI